VVAQVGSHKSVTLPSRMPESEHLKDLEPLGWIHTQPNEVPQLLPSDVIAHARLVTDSKSWDPDKAIVMTCSITPGACSLTAYRLTPTGLEWGKKNRDAGEFPEVKTHYLTNTDCIASPFSFRSMASRALPWGLSLSVCVHYRATARRATRRCRCCCRTASWASS
jgi:pre-mRNA-processing factor 8